MLLCLRQTRRLPGLPFRDSWYLISNGLYVFVEQAMTYILFKRSIPWSKLRVGIKSIPFPCWASDCVIALRLSGLRGLHARRVSRGGFSFNLVGVYERTRMAAMQEPYSDLLFLFLLIYLRKMEMTLARVGLGPLGGFALQRSPRSHL